MSDIKVQYIRTLAVNVLTVYICTMQLVYQVMNKPA